MEEENRKHNEELMALKRENRLKVQSYDEKIDALQR